MSHEQVNDIGTIYVCPKAESYMFHALDKDAYIIITFPDGAVLIEKFIGKPIALCVTPSDHFEQKRWYALDPETQEIVNNAFDTNKSSISVAHGRERTLRYAYFSAPTDNEDERYGDSESAGMGRDDTDMFFDSVLERMTETPTQFPSVLMDEDRIVLRCEFRLHNQAKLEK